jgi:hypothetical protein
MDTRLQNLLHDLATEMPVDVEGTAPRTLRRARVRRVLTGGAGAAIAVALVVVVSMSALRFGDEPTVTPGVTGPNPPATFEGLWPEADSEALAVTQASIRDGHDTLRTTPEGTTTLLATNLLGWELSSVRTESLAVSEDRATVTIDNRLFGDQVPVITVELRQLGETGSQGAWSVVGVSSPLIDLQSVMVTEDPAVLRVSGQVSTLYDGAPTVEGGLVTGPIVAPGISFELTDRTFQFEFGPLEPTPTGKAALLLTMPDAVGASLGAVMVAVPTPVGEPEPPEGPNLEGVPPDVAVTAQLIYDAALAGDVDALAPLLDPNTFAYNFDDGSDPIPAWRADPSVLDPMAAVLELPAAEPRTIRGYGTLTIWPYLIDTDFDALTERERDDLKALGYSEADIELMIEGGNGYQGPRLAIDETGLWRSFTTMGE